MDMVKQPDFEAQVTDMALQTMAEKGYTGLTIKEIKAGEFDGQYEVTFNENPATVKFVYRPATVTLYAVE